MTDTHNILVGRGGELVTAPASNWLAALNERSPQTREKLRLSGDARQIREYVVRELPRFGKPLPPRQIAEDLALARSVVVHVLEELERRLFFLVRNQDGDVAWAFPVAAAPTPHQLLFDTGERINGA